MKIDRMARMEPGNRWKKAFMFVFVGLVLLPLLLFAAWTWVTLNFNYSTGELAGYVQKISKKGWICKTWEGEIAMANLPGTMPEIFAFTVRDDAVAREIERLAGRRVSLTYEQHRGIPTSCFGETQYFVVQVTPLQDALPATVAPVIAPAAEASQEKPSVR